MRGTGALRRSWTTADCEWLFCSVDLASAKLTPMSYVFEKANLPADRSRIDVLDPAEIRWWSNLLGCHPRQLVHAVSRVGECAAQVERLLDSQYLPESKTTAGETSISGSAPRAVH